MLCEISPSLGIQSYRHGPEHGVHEQVAVDIPLVDDVRDLIPGPLNTQRASEFGGVLYRACTTGRAGCQ